MGRWWIIWLRCVRVSICCCFTLAISGAPAHAINWPPQVSVAFDFPPSPLIQGGTAHLVYEILLTNFAHIPYVLESIDVKAGDQRFAFTGAMLTSMMRIIGVNGAPGATRRIEGGRAAIVYVTLDFNTTTVPSAVLLHALHLTSPEMERQVLSPEPLVPASAGHLEARRTYRTSGIGAAEGGVPGRERGWLPSKRECG